MADLNSFAEKLDRLSMDIQVINWSSASSVGRFLSRVLELKSHLPEDRREELEPLIGSLIEGLNMLILGRQEDIKSCLDKSGLLLKTAKTGVN